MRILLLEIDFYLPGCRSLKEKRQRLGRLSELLGRSPRIAVAETGGQDHHCESRFTVLVLADDSGAADRQSSRIEALLGQLDALVVGIERRWLR